MNEYEVYFERDTSINVLAESAQDAKAKALQHWSVQDDGEVVAVVKTGPDAC